MSKGNKKGTATFSVAVPFLFRPVNLSWQLRPGRMNQAGTYACSLQILDLFK
jgi:hypothetical protein